MRAIPDTLRTKINQAFQTIHGNNQPRMDIIAQKVTKYLTEGTLLQARTIRTGTDLGPLDICIRREDVNADPTEIIMAYIENGTAKVATLPYVHTPDQEFTYQYTIGEAVDVACDFDGGWYKITDRTGIYFDTSIIWALQTFGEPYLVRVMTDGTLHIQQGQSGASLQLADSGVTKVSCLRGWKNTYLWNHDQGIIVAYIRSGAVCYRNYAQQPPDQPALWENERTITEFATPASNVSIFRTNDYRVGILAEISGAMHWVLTDRNWATMAIEAHYISATIKDVLVDLKAITYTDIYHEHTISAAVTEAAVLYCPAIWPQVVSISNPSTDDTVTILIECDLNLYGDLTGLQAAFTVVDGIGTPYTVSATAKGLTGNIIKLTVANFEGASGDLTVTYTFNTAPIYSQVDGGCLMELSSFSQAFTPLIAPPEGYSDHTISATVTGVTVNLLNVQYIEPYTTHTISTAVTGVAVTLIHVNDINP